MDTRTFDTRTLRIRELNNALRSGFPYSSGNGKIVISSAIREHEAEDDDLWHEIVDAIRNADFFTDDNDPYSEHDMAFFECHGEKLFWKIDCYDLPFPAHSSDEATYRVLTVWFAEKY